MEKITKYITKILSDTKYDNKSLILRDHIKYIKKSFHLSIKNNNYEYYNGTIDLLKEGYDIIEIETKSIKEHIEENSENICFIK